MASISDFISHVSEHPASVAVPAALFFLLAPGNFLTVGGDGGIIDFSSVNPNRTVILAHAAILGVALAYLQRNYPSYY